MQHRILIIDDDSDLRTLVRRWLERDGHVVGEAEDGPAGLGAALDGNYDVALVDIGLPVYDGYEIARRVRAAPVARRPCLVALTSNTDDPDVAFAAGFDAHVYKPVQAAAIAAVIEGFEQRERK